ncbi:MAG: hypothetical protein P0Y50_03140 [Candidatus Brevundimonas colombiensis]|uniref:Uncharacterized protein n=1 Tax=Candidatus Brevundimonas colombiensis TaxID=3121376 RepID=A0AAJ5X1U2_9CAUL|nr:hypothetical protein [Brevundimonas sp.]WEK40617.1 MAG: hypothetical protein P0Y50_03140 [Brevundimonas sp.]
MTDRIGPIGGPERIERREGERRERERRARAASRDLVPLDPPEPQTQTQDRPARAAVQPAAEPGAAAFVAQQMGQGGQKRGLRGGPPVLDAARSAYLGTEYSGAAERRPTTGKTTKTDI